MMILSRIWYVILALVVGAAIYVVYLAVGQYNRRNQAAMDETLKADSQVVSWAMQVDARRRLDVLLLAAVDPSVAKAIQSANGKEPIPASSKDDGAKALRAFNEKAGDYKSDALFAVDREGRMVAQIGYDQANASPDFELGGYAAVFDALHGFLRDDTWVWGGRIARVVTRPVEAEVGQPPLGAVVALRWVDNAYAKEIGKRTRTNIAFFALGQRVGSAALEGFDEASLEALGSDLGNVMQDKQWKESGRTDVRPLGTGEKGGVLYVRLPGDAWELGGGFAVAREKVSVASPAGFVQGADDADKRNVKLWLIALIVVGLAGLGILFSFLEHSLPMSEMSKQAARLKKGEIDVLQLPRFRGGFRPIATDINDGIQRVVEKGGGQARKPADLESILGPVPAQPNMSAFSFPMPDGSSAQPAPAMPPSGPGSFQGPGPAAPAPFPNAPAPAASRPGPPVPPSGASRPNGPGGPGPGPGPGTFPNTMQMGNAPPPPFGQAPPAPGSHSATVAASPGANANKLASAVTSPAPFPPQSPGLPQLAKQAEEDEQTMVAQPSADLIAATGGGPAVADPAAEWHNVYEEFIRTKRGCGEPTDGLTFEKFQQTLKKNRDALMQRHGCKRVKFSVYVKEGRASLKATPVRE
jgi:hypothetical protein